MSIVRQSGFGEESLDYPGEFCLRGMDGGKSSLIAIVLLTFAALNQVYRHLLTGIGAYFYITWGVWLRHCLNGRQQEYILIWPRIVSLPEVVRSANVESNTGIEKLKKLI